MLPSLAALSLATDADDGRIGQKRQSSRRQERNSRQRVSDASSSAPLPKTNRVYTDSSDPPRTVFSDLSLPVSPASDEPVDPASTQAAARYAAALEELRKTLRDAKPTLSQVIQRRPFNVGRYSHEITSNGKVVDAFVNMLKAACTLHKGFDKMLRETFGTDRCCTSQDSEDDAPRVALLGAQWIVPYLTMTQNNGFLPEQKLHTDVGEKGKVLAVALSVKGDKLGTYFDPWRSLDSTNEPTKEQCLRANTDVFAYDTGMVHAGPGRELTPDKEFYSIDRVFFLLVSPELDEASVKKFQSDNNLAKTAMLRTFSP